MNPGHLLVGRIKHNRDDEELHCSAGYMSLINICVYIYIYMERSKNLAYNCRDAHMRNLEAETFSASVAND